MMRAAIRAIGTAGRAAGAGMLLLLGGCSAVPDGAESREAVGAPTAWVYDVDAGRFLEEAEVWPRLAAADFLLLGETHDNAEHHRLQARILRRLADVPPGIGAVAFEMLREDQQPLVDRHLGDGAADLGSFAEAVGWQQSGWPDFALYEPVFAAALDSGARILAADLARGLSRRIREQGPAALDPELVRRTGLDRPLPPALEAGLREILTEAHCGRLPDRMLPGLLRVQRARDAVMAARMADFEGPGRVVLITGSGHARKDWGVPFYLRRLAPQKRILSLSFLEMAPGAKVKLKALPYDLVWLTAAPDRDRPDPCDAIGPPPAGNAPER